MCAPPTSGSSGLKYEIRLSCRISFGLKLEEQERKREREREREEKERERELLIHVVPTIGRQ